MNKTADSLPLLTKLTKAVLIIVTTFCGSLNATLPDRSSDEAAQLNSSDSCVATKSSARRAPTVIGRRATAETRGERGEPFDQSCTAAASTTESEDFLSAPNPSMMPRTSFGAGSFALSALGESASGHPRS
jgi:hypothetical protein